jgi:SAM-dependent methyltransferase
MSCVEATEVRKLASLEDTHWWYAERRILVAELIRSAQFPDPSRVVALDIGAAGGGNTRVLEGAGIFAVPVEYGPDGAHIARERGLKAVRGDACKLPFADRSVDLVLAFDVLEHLDDGPALREICRVLRPGGRLWVAVPADMRLWSGHDEAVGHLRRYSRAGLVSAVADAGLDIIELKSWNVLLRPLVEVRRRRSTESDLGSIRPVTNWLLARVISLERRLTFTSRWPGVSLLLQARRSPDSPQGSERVDLAANTSHRFVDHGEEGDTKA